MNEIRTDFQVRKDLDKLCKAVVHPAASEPAYDEEGLDLITVKFTTLDETVFTQSYTNTLNIGNVKVILAKIFSVPSMIIKLLDSDGKEVSDEMVLTDFQVELYGKIELTLLSADPGRVISAADAYKDLVPVDVITVKVEDPCYAEGYRELVVEIEDRRIKKPFLGGFVNMQTHLEYHHGYSQTGPRKPKVPPWMMNHRDTQTYWYRSRLYDTIYERPQQMANENTWIPNDNDKIMVAKPYETAEEREKRLDVPGKTRLIQKCIRAWKLRKAIRALSDEYKKRIRLEKEYEEFLKTEDEDRRRTELIAKVFPRTKTDFRVLFAMVHRWKLAEIRRICDNFSGPAKVAEFYLLLEKEIQLLNAIEKQKKKLAEDTSLRKQQEFFDAIGNPLEWNSSYKNLYCQMDTLETQRGRQYRQLFLAFQDPDLCKERRLNALVNIKFQLQENEHNCQVSIELVELIDRYCVLLTRGFTYKNLEMLQKRIEHLLLKHFNQRFCNDGVTNRVVRVKQKLMEENLFFCYRCNKLKGHKQFPITSETKKLRICNACEWIDHIGSPPENMRPYDYILKCIRREERRKEAKSSIAFVLCDTDIKYIVDNIWHGHSLLSECDNILDLRLPRWEKDKEWSPWNCILLTTDEMKSHYKIEKLNDAYEKEFIDRVKSKHLDAMVHFKKAKNYGNTVKYGVDWSKIEPHIEFVPVNSKEKLPTRCH